MKRKKERCLCHCHTSEIEYMHTIGCCKKAERKIKEYRKKQKTGIKNISKT